MALARSTFREDPQIDALARFLAPSPARPCQACRHARATAHDGFHRVRDAVTPYPCEVERASTPLEAWLYGACGTRGRYFEATMPATPRRGVNAAALP